MTSIPSSTARPAAPRTDIAWAANLTLLFTEAPSLERPALARAEGFDLVEMWWPFGTDPRPSDAEVDAFAASFEDAGVRLVHMNLFAGDMPAGERGVLSYPEGREDFLASIRVATRIADRLGTALFNAPVGHRRAGLDPAEQDRTMVELLGEAARILADHGARVLLEPVSRMPDYPLKRTADCLSLIERVREETGEEAIAYLLDQYHLMVNGEDVFETLPDAVEHLAHVQIADVPGRGEPGSGTVPLDDYLDRLLAAGYAGAVALEFIPARSTSESLAAWRAAGRRG